MLERAFHLRQNGATARTEVVAGVTTFLTMSYIIFVQPAVLSGVMFGQPTGMDVGAITTATCLAAALASAIMGLYARYPIAQAPGMGENFFFVFSAIPAAAAAIPAVPWATAPGAVFISRVPFLLLSLVGVREAVMISISPGMKHAIAAGIGLFIAFIGLQNAGLVLKDPRHGREAQSALRLAGPRGVLRRPGGRRWPACAPYTRLDPVGHPCSRRSGRRTEARTAAARRFRHSCPGRRRFGADAALRDRGPRARQAFVSDAVGTVAGACLGTSTVTSYVESATGVEQGGRTGLTAVTVAALFLLALFFGPVIEMLGGYAPVTAPALVPVGAMMLRNVAQLAWDDFTELLPAFLVVVGIPLSHSIADGPALGFVSYPVVKVLGGRLREVRWMSWFVAGLLLTYFVFVRSRA